MDTLVKIAYLVRPVDGGIKTHLLTLLAGLDRLHYAPTVICPPGSSLAEAVTSMGIPVIPLDITGELNPIKDVQAALQLRNILKTLQPDILHIHSAKAGLVGRLALRGKHRPKVILTMHSFVFDERSGPRKRALVARMERYFARVTDRIIAVSQALKDELVSEMELNPDLISVVYNGVPFYDTVKLPFTGTRIGTVARLAPQKGLETFIHAAALVLGKKPNVTVTIAGDGPLKGHLKTLADSLSIPEAIEFLGHQKDVPALLATFNVFVLASTRETFGLTVVEALSQEVPVVATRVGGIPEIIEDGKTGLLAESGNPHDIAEKILRLLDDPAYAHQLAVAGNASVRERFNCQRMVAETEAIYAGVMEKRRKVRR